MDKDKIFIKHAHFVCPEDAEGYFVMDKDASMNAMEEYAKYYGRWLLLNHYGLGEGVVDEDNDGLYSEFLTEIKNP